MKAEDLPLVVAAGHEVVHQQLHHLQEDRGNFKKNLFSDRNLTGVLSSLCVRNLLKVSRVMMFFCSQLKVLINSVIKKCLHEPCPEILQSLRLPCRTPPWISSAFCKPKDTTQSGDTIIEGRREER